MQLRASGLGCFAGVSRAELYLRTFGIVLFHVANSRLPYFTNYSSSDLSFYHTSTMPSLVDRDTDDKKVSNQHVYFSNPHDALRLAVNAIVMLVPDGKPDS